MAVTLGAKAFTKVVAKSESAYGTPSSFNDANGELLHTDIVGVIDPGVTVDLADDKSAGIRPKRLASSATVTAKAPVITLADAPVSARNLPIYFDALATITPTGSGPYSWVYTPSATDVDTIKTYSLYLTDGVQKYIGIGMPQQSFFKRYLHTAQHQRTTYNQGMCVPTFTNSYVHFLLRSKSSAKAKSGG
jgi:hypothetical protein